MRDPYARRLVLAMLLAVSVLAPAPLVAQAPPDAVAEADRLAEGIEALVETRQLDVAAQTAARVLALRQKALPPTDPRVADAMNDLGALYVLLDDTVRAAPLLTEAVARLEASRPGSKEHASAVSNLAALHAARGETSQATTLRERALVLAERAHGPDAPALAVAKRVLALAVARRDVRRAEELLASARTIHEKAGDERGAILDMLALANVKRDLARTGAEPLYQEALTRAEKAFGPDDLETAQVMLSVARANRRSAASAGSRPATDRVRALADQQYTEATRVLTKVYGQHHTKVAEAIAEHALNAEAGSDIARAVELRRRANDLEESQLAIILASESESVKLAYLDKLRRHADDTVGLHLGAYFRGTHHPEAAELALTTLLRRKGRALDAVASGVAGLRRRMGDGGAEVLDRLQRARGELAALVVRGPGARDAGAYRAEVDAVTRRVQELDQEASARSAAYRVQAEPVTLDAVRARIPDGAALVELVRVAPRDARAYSAVAELRSPRYVAYVLRREGPVKFVYLGEASLIEAQVGQVRRALMRPDSERFADPASRLYTTTLGRIGEATGDASHLLIAPDGALNLVPFGALVGDRAFALDRWTFTYLSSGRDLLQQGAGPSPRTPATIVADPTFDASTEGSAGGSRAGTLAGAVFPPLPGTRQEGEALRERLRGSSLLLGEGATEAAMKDLRGPALLHVATHGFFLGGEERTGGRDRGLELVDGPPGASPERPAPPVPPARWRIQSPLLRSGLALAGASRRRGGAHDDGILTAMEAAGLDLHGTEIVTLSACETGLGDLVAGEGVFGLRRAFVIAGAQTQVMSLWKVDDDATRDLMIGYYERLLAGGGRSSAMRAAQLAMRDVPGREHPFYWAAFIVSGDAGPLPSLAANGTPGPAPAPSGTLAPSGPRGCACRVAGTHGGARAAWLLALAIGSTAVARRRSRR